jgi:hypothetical protein
VIVTQQYGFYQNQYLEQWGPKHLTNQQRFDHWIDHGGKRYAIELAVYFWGYEVKQRSAAKTREAIKWKHSKTDTTTEVQDYRFCDIMWIPELWMKS